VQRTLAPRRPHDWAEASDAPIMAAMADTAAIMTTSFFMTPPFARSEIRPKVVLLSRRVSSLSEAPFTRVTLSSRKVPMVLEQASRKKVIWAHDDEVAKTFSL